MMMKINIINTQVTNIQSILPFLVLKKEQMKAVVTPKIEERDTYFVINKITKKTVIATKKISGQKAIAIPALQAIPFPPLKSAKIGKFFRKKRDFAFVLFII